jgi:hypothetical protein
MPSATAAGFLGFSGLGGGAVPVASATMAKASWLMSRGRLCHRRGALRAQVGLYEPRRWRPELHPLGKPVPLLAEV